MSIDRSARWSLSLLTRTCGLALVAGLAACANQQTDQAATTDSGTATSTTTAAPAAKPAAGFTDGTPSWIAYVGGKEYVPANLSLGDGRTVAAILEEGKYRSRVMDHLRHLTQQIGPRLTGSKRAKQANDWCAEQYRAWGLTNVQVEQWGTFPVEFNRGPSTGKVLLRSESRNEDGSTSAAYGVVRELQFSTQAWTVGTNGPVRGPIIPMPETEAEYHAVKDKLKGAWVLRKAAPAVGQRGVRDRMNSALGSAAETRAKVAEGTKIDELPWEQRILFAGINGYISTTRDERVWTSGARRVEIDKMPPDISITIRLSDYDYINSRLADKEPVELEFDLKHELVKGPAGCYNTIAEIRGSEWPEQVVIVSAHLDSWDGPGSQGATDNGTGSVVTLEAARILAATGAKPKRTIRFIHWTGEEQGLLGSAAYVKMHADEMKNISCVFVDDGGTNYQGGIECIEPMKDLMAAASAPINGVFTDDVTGKPLTVNIRVRATMPRSGSSDHASFNAVGVPGFYWDEVGRAEYPYGWHTQNDKLELAIPVYLQQSATCSAVTAYRLACAPTLLPRQPTEPAPKP